MLRVFITGVAGFIGSNLTKRLLETESDIQIIGLDNMNDYYNVELKEYRLKQLIGSERFLFIKGNIADKICVENIFSKYHPDIVVNLDCELF